LHYKDWSCTDDTPLRHHQDSRHRSPPWSPVLLSRALRFIRTAIDIGCVEAGIDARFEPYGGSDPLAYVVSLNLKRWHLDESQRAMVAVRIANVRQGARTELQLKTEPPCCSTLASVRFSAPADVIIQPRLTIVAMAITPNSTDDLNKRVF
jgi:hypothetical protein